VEGVTGVALDTVFAYRVSGIDGEYRFVAYRRIQLGEHCSHTDTPAELVEHSE
jgi:hypothetical protein